MPVSEEKLRRRAVKAGVRASKKRRHAVSRNELLGLRIQTMPAVARILLGTVGVVLIAAAWFEWPSQSNTVCGLEAAAGIVLVLAGFVGVRRTLAGLIDQSSGELIEFVLESIGEIFSHIDL